MQDISSMLAAGCYFCKRHLTPEAAKCGTMSIRIVGTEVWTEPIAVVCHETCAKREGEVSH